MLSRRMAFGTIVIAFVIYASLAGACPPATIELVPCEGVTTWPDNTYRWKDIASNLYSQWYQDNYAYDDASVYVTFDMCGDSTLSGHLSAENLKPNFAYQMKLVGKPESLWGDAGDDTTNENIGYTGRWWRHSPTAGNSNDAEYEEHHDDPDYIFEGYLVFDFFITDRFGKAEVDFETKSSYHVLFWEDQRTPGSCDSPVKWSLVTGDPTDPAYDHDIDSVEVGVYAQIERLCYNQTTLPEGLYNCRFLLTEESFHESGLGGYWASAMVCDTMFFRINIQSAVDGTTSPVPWMVKPMYPNPFREEATVEMGLPGPAPLLLKVYDIRGSVIRTIEVPLAGVGCNRMVWDGRDSSGRPVADGVYMYRIEIPGRGNASGKVVLMK
jgi:hypothetical protein